MPLSLINLSLDSIESGRLEMQRMIPQNQLWINRTLRSIDRYDPGGLP